MEERQITNLVSCLNLKGVNIVTLQSEPSYNILLNFSIQNLSFGQPEIPKPAAIVLPDTVEQLQSSILCCREHGPFVIRIRSGGHSYEGLSYSIGKRETEAPSVPSKKLSFSSLKREKEAPSVPSKKAKQTPFVIIDMMNLNRVNVDTISYTAWVEAGATLGEIYYEIAKSTSSHGFSAGGCPTVGSGGHFSGGGVGLLSRKYGLAADNIVDAKLVDAQGQILDRQSMGEDVFWAIRGGGGGSWGAVYAWKIKLLAVPKIVTAFAVPRAGKRREVAKLVHKWQLVAPKVEDELSISVYISADSGLSATFHALYLGPKVSMLPILNRDFPELNITDQDCHEMTWIQSVLFFSHLKRGSKTTDLKDRLYRKKSFFKVKSDYIRDPIPLDGIESLMENLEEEPKGSVEFDPYGGMMDRIPQDALPFPHRAGNLYSIHYTVSWEKNDESRSEHFVDWIRKLYHLMGRYASKNPRAAYVNFIDLDLVDWPEQYFNGNYRTLVRVKNKIDPENVFNHPQSIPPE